MERRDIDGHPTIGGGAVIRLSKQAIEEIRKGLTRMDQTFISVGPMMIELAKVLQEMGEPIDPEVTAHLGMTPDGGYRAPERNGEEESFPIRRAYPGPS